MPTLVVFMR